MSEFDILSDSNIEKLKLQIASNTFQESESIEEKNEAYKSFVDCLYEKLEKCFEKMESNSKLHQDSGEVRISHDIEMFLEGADINCNTETNSNGHVDLYVTYNDFKWLGEAKIHKGDKWTHHGFRQLTENYSTGRQFNCRGGILVYNKCLLKNSKQCAEDWRKYLDNLDIETDSTEYLYGKFDTIIKEHPRSGEPYYLRSFFINLQYTESKDFD